MTYECLLFSAEGPVATITFNRPHVLNALNSRTMQELGDSLDVVRRDSTIRALILTGAGSKAFVAGADINELAQGSPIESQQRARHDQEIMTRLETMGKPSIAAINGFALGGGCELALACTIRIASRAARLGQPEVKLGIIPGCGGTQRLPRLCGKAVAYQLILTGDVITAEEALRIGLVNRVVEPAELIAVCQQMAAGFASSSPLIVKSAMEMVEHSLETVPQQASFWESCRSVLPAATEMDLGSKGYAEFVEKYIARLDRK
jgi:enoyl-CoA hydratase